MNQEFNKNYNLIHLISIFLDNKKAIIITSLIVGLITAFVMFFVLDPIFLSSAVVKTSNKSSASTLTSLLGEGIPDFSDIGNLTGGSGAKEMALYEDILISRRNIEETLLKFQLNNEWEFKYFEEAVKNFRENILEIKKNKISGTMEIGVYDKYPERAKQITEFLIYQLNKISTELNVQNAKNNREFIEKRYYAAKEQLKMVEDSMKIFQDQFGLAPDIVAKASVQGEVQLEVEIKSEEVKLELLQKILSPGQSEIKLQQDKINLLKKQLNDMKNIEDPESSISQKGKPQLVLNYMRLVRNLEIQNKIVLFLLPIYEQAKIEEFKEMPSVIILDAPNIPEKKVKPKRLTMTVLAAFASFIMAFGFFVVKERYNSFASLVKKSRNEQ